MYERLVEECGHETIAELVGANLQQELTAQGMGLVNALWDNRDQITPGSQASVGPQDVSADDLAEEIGSNDD